MNSLANTILVLHALIVLFIVGGLIAIWAGAAFGCAWARNRVFRIAHIVAIGIVATLAVVELPCPLTVLEDRLRTGQSGTQGFIQRWVGAFLYFDFPAWVFTLAYVAFFLAVVATWRGIPPRRTIQNDERAR
ncbi:hypothetical protein BTHE68_52710 [Burkholderia sp. THE68]|uniref:DUF2784 domain-containing protein n=1 Tax=Burkholderia sp. THE68 TaxID=758782 RepID=UPI001317A76B|nr:DUF2784 domain-containing protein [Burkholderia sp. THE68]BBU31537.1 hypothetical protein BTHE68_52710 [Burkholderia sp. THE68]